MNRHMGLDLGEATIGIALSDPGFTMAFSHESYRRVSVEDDISHLIDLILEYEVVKIVAGLPINLNGEIGKQAQSVMSFAKKLEKKIKYTNRLINRPDVVFQDERFSTREAKRSMEDLYGGKKMKRYVDKIAAQIILQSYIDQSGSNSPSSHGEVEDR